jgi:hypothetical protein
MYPRIDILREFAGPGLYIGGKKMTAIIINTNRQRRRTRKGTKSVFQSVSGFRPVTANHVLIEAEHRWHQKLPQRTTQLRC